MLVQKKMLYLSVNQTFSDGSGLGQAQIYDGDKQFNGMPTTLLFS
jgi:hypothetical protein